MSCIGLLGLDQRLIKIKIKVRQMRAQPDVQDVYPNKDRNARTEHEITVPMRRGHFFCGGRPVLPFRAGRHYRASSVVVSIRHGPSSGCRQPAAIPGRHCELRPSQRVQFVGSHAPQTAPPSVLCLTASAPSCQSTPGARKAGPCSCRCPTRRGNPPSPYQHRCLSKVSYLSPSSRSQMRMGEEQGSQNPLCWYFPSSQYTLQMSVLFTSKASQK
jgi:hypothetical protein